MSSNSKRQNNLQLKIKRFTTKVIISLIAVIIGIYIVKKGNELKKNF